MERWHAKVICGVIMFLAMPICFLLPVKMVDVVNKYGARGQLCLDLLTCFAGGVFLSSYLVFMAPAVRVLIEVHVMKPNGIEYPLPDMLIGIGFFIMLALDKLVNFINAKNTESRPRRNGEVPRSRHESTSSQMRCSESGAKLVTEEEPMEMQQDELNDNYHNPHLGSMVSIRHAITANGDVSVALSRTVSIANVASSSSESTVRSVVMMMALSIDSVLEGMTIGLKKTVIEVWAIFIGIIVHESVIAFCLGLQLVRVNRNRLTPVFLACAVYTLMNPIGVIISTPVYETMENDPGVEIANGVLQALTSGCFIYVIFYEILEGQVTQNTPVCKIFAIFLGYIFLSSFAAVPGSYHQVAVVNHCHQNSTTNDTQGRN